MKIPRLIRPFSLKLAAVACLVLLQAVSSFAANFYIDSVGGSDGNSGSSSATPWKSLSKVNGTTFAAGDHIFFKAGDGWTGQLYPKGSGASGSPIVIDSYGSGSKPMIQGNGTTDSTVYLHNQQYWEINNLDISNNAGSSSSSLGDFRGIGIHGQDAGTLNHFVVQNCYIHNVTGWVKWIGGTGTDGGGIFYKTGWDASKKTGGIVLWITTADNQTKTHFNDIVIQNNRIENCSMMAVTMKQWAGTVGWGLRKSASDSNFVPHTHVTIANNYLNQSNTALGSINYSCDAIYVTDVRDATVTNNMVAGAGTTGIELYFTDNVVVANNEVCNVTKKAGGGDTNGIDSDKCTTNTIIEYNYVHDSKLGLLLYHVGGFGSSIVRYNIFQNNTTNAVWFNSEPTATSQLYNNVFYCTNSQPMVRTSLRGGSGIFKNNIFYCTASGSTFQADPHVSYDYNCYFGMSGPTDAHKIIKDPKFVNPGKGGTGGIGGTAMSSLDGYKLQSSSPCINAGTVLSNNGGIDFWGNTLYNAAPDIGAHEFGAAGNLPPTVSITAPTTGASFAAGANITIQASAVDSDGAVSSVAFYQGSTLLGTSTSSPYSFIWNNVGAGNYTLTAVAMDNDGATTPSSPVNLTVGAQGPVVVQSESGTWDSSSGVSTKHAGYTGTGFVDTASAVGVWSEVTVNVPTAGNYSIDFRYANGGTSDRPVNLSINGTVVNTGLSFPQTSSWTTWSDVIVTATLKAGNNTIRITATKADGTANLDRVTVQ